MKTLADYTVVIMPDDGTSVAYVPAIEGCHALGDSPDEAQTELEGVLEMFRDIFAEQNRPLPPDVRELVAVSR